MKKRLLLLLVYLALALTLPGCWDYVEYENITQVIGMGIDYDSKTQETTISIQFPALKKRTGGSETTAPSQWIVQSATEKTFYGALTKLQETVPNRLFLGYLKVIIIGEEAAKYNLMDTIDYFDRTPSLRSSANIVIAAGKAEDVLKTIRPDRGRPASDEIHTLIHGSTESGAAYPVTVNDFIQMLAIGGWEATAPRVSSVAAKAQQEDTKGGTQESIRANEERIGSQRVAGLAAFKGDKFVGWLNEKESMGVGWITGKKMHAYKVSEPAGGVGAEELYYHVTDSNSKIKVRLVNGLPIIDVDVKVVADLKKYSRGEGADFLSAEAVSDAEKKLTDNIRSDIDAALIRGQKELNTDIFGFGFAFFREYPGLWQDKYEAQWANIFPCIPINVTVHAKVINTGSNISKLIIR